ncbi:hypothetical protein GOZ97_00085 [Agrobacterium vitis]|uniref:hypothetical protein n=1 Tax=Rhizobium/Agrobacterium group TaxID=227290 RepID=UPI0008DBF055|nr:MULTISPECIES: hypothetical protein [Rhizobium/Agrobacterium group]MCF1436962.1 hypothetical protein [Allorhizobium ampelinum]MUO92547.1 hypothetical protein [Agrobacterium vitis]MUZ51976.1 hypothetical protein [Agrobacterium vitis]MUZ89807.1 hypothetical protein [Agrobacterium vitis]MVA39578.1 hypothetical protein [Agrobacterium vitis]
MTINIHPDVAYRELSAQADFLKQRNLALAQTLAEVIAERDQLQAELKALTTTSERENADGAAQ